MNKTILISILFIISCSEESRLDPYIIVLGTTQDGGAPQAGCNKNCCINRWASAKKEFFVTSLGIVDPNSKEAWMIEATPDFPHQLKKLSDENRTLVFYESPHKLLKTLTQFSEIFGPDRGVSVSRELSKMFEETFEASVQPMIEGTGNRKPKRAQKTAESDGRRPSKTTTKRSKDGRECTK